MEERSVFQYLVRTLILGTLLGIVMFVIYIAAAVIRGR